MDMADHFDGYHVPDAKSEDYLKVSGKPENGISPKPESISFFSRNLEALRVDLRAYLGSFLNRSADVDDCFQEVSLVLWQKKESTWQSEDFRRYAFRVARNQAALLLRKQGRTPLLGADLAEEIASRIADESAPSAEAEERLSALAACLKKLPERHREIVETRYYGAGKLKHLADSRGQSESSLYKRLERIRTALRDCVNGRIKGI